MSIQIPDDLIPAQVGGKVTDAEYISDGNKTQHTINEEVKNDLNDKIDDAPTDDGIYVRKNGVWSKLIIDYDESTETLTIDTRGQTE